MDSIETENKEITLVYQTDNIFNILINSPNEFLFDFTLNQDHSNQTATEFTITRHSNSDADPNSGHEGLNTRRTDSVINEPVKNLLHEAA